MSCGEVMPPPTVAVLSFGCVLPSSAAYALVAAAMERRTTASNLSECLHIGWSPCVQDRPLSAGSQYGRQIMTLIHLRRCGAADSAADDAGGSPAPHKKPVAFPFAARLRTWCRSYRSRPRTCDSVRRSHSCAAASFSYDCGSNSCDARSHESRLEENIRSRVT